MMELPGMRLNFTIEKTATGSKARAGTFQTLHGEVQTPLFMPVGTQATVKAQSVESLKMTGSRMLLANTYHLLLRPGPEVFKRFGGIHRFMNWDGPVLTDSGGYQIFSLPSERAINEDGARFRSYVDGNHFLLSPESSIEMQKAIGSDIMMVLDHCIASTALHAETEAAMRLTHRWAERSLLARGESAQALFGIVQGACHHDLREQSAQFLSGLPFDGLAIGGLAVGETHQERYAMTGHVTDYLPARLPRYLMGVGTPIDLLESVHRGVDMFDCIIPNQLAQRGTVFTSRGKIHLRRSVHKFAERPVDANCDCNACRDYSRAYLHHLIKTGEVLGWHLLTIHNLTFYHRLMKEMRDAILQNDFLEFYERQRRELVRTDEEHPNRPVTPRQRTEPDTHLGDYEVHASPDGFSSIRQISSGEVMHSVNDPSEEANKLYVEQSCLGSRLAGPSASADELVIWDVGLGAGSNAMAALHCFESEWKRRAERVQARQGAAIENRTNAGPLHPMRAMRLVSFEHDLDSLKLAVGNSRRFPHVRHGAPHELLKNGTWNHSSGLLCWQLIEGDFLERFEAAKSPDLIFYDPFSYKTDARFWTSAVFSRILEKVLPKSAELYTYSASTAVRAALLTAGFFVAEGVRTGPKTSTTLAFTRASGAVAHPLAPALLGQDWLARWNRSHSKFPAGLADEAKPDFEMRIESHPQFSGSARVAVE
jgi:queuine tRNA-ribosyltransferase